MVPKKWGLIINMTGNRSPLHHVIAGWLEANRLGRKNTNKSATSRYDALKKMGCTFWCWYFPLKPAISCICKDTAIMGYAKPMWNWLQRDWVSRCDFLKWFHQKYDTAATKCGNNEVESTCVCSVHYFSMCFQSERGTEGQIRWRRLAHSLLQVPEVRT